MGNYVRNIFCYFTLYLLIRKFVTSVKRLKKGSAEIFEIWVYFKYFVLFEPFYLATAQYL